MASSFQVTQPLTDTLPAHLTAARNASIATLFAAAAGSLKTDGTAYTVKFAESIVQPTKTAKGLAVVAGQYTLSMTVVPPGG